MGEKGFGGVPSGMGFFDDVARKGECMVIRPMVAAHAMGEMGRSAASMGAKGGPASFLSPLRDEVTLSGKPRGSAGVYSGTPLLKIMGAVELMHGRIDIDDVAESRDYGVC